MMQALNVYIVALNTKLKNNGFECQIKNNDSECLTEKRWLLTPNYEKKTPNSTNIGLNINNMALNT